MRLQGVDLADILPHGSFAYGIPVWGISFDVDLDWLLNTDPSTLNRTTIIGYRNW
jgi:hypothetical protein